MPFNSKLLLITPPFTQLNTPYPATAYLKGFLNTQNIVSFQADLGIEVINKLFCKQGLSLLFNQLNKIELEVSDNIFRIFSMQQFYLQTIDAVIAFLQNKNPTLAHAICDRTFLPEGARFNDIEDLEWAFGTMGLQDKARHLATLYLEDLGDLIKETIDPHFGFSRYAERLGRTASSFNELHDALNAPNSIITEFLKELLYQKIENFHPDIVCLSVPFPGNLFAALKCGQFIKKQYKNIKVVLGGGYANTELRSVSDVKVFDYIDFISLDDGEAPLLNLIGFIENKQDVSILKRTFLRTNENKVLYCHNPKLKDIAFKDTGTPDYSDFPLSDYISVIEIANPMHRLWSDGRWNKLTLAHGCYWGKCSFCDISLDYIKNYEPLTASLICDRIETIIAQTQQNGFHFVDEAAPPSLLKEVSLEIIRRNITIAWWTNIRFEKHFTDDLAKLMKASGCIAVAGGLEVASDRLLSMMQKGVTVSQVAQVANSFTQAGIMVHAYLMYGFPTQTIQETIDSLEMVRQLFQNGVLQSGFWHRFAMTAHSPVGLKPQEFKVQHVGPVFDGFAENDYYHEDILGGNHDLFSEGLKKSLFNYMHGVCLDFDLQEWFDFEIPATNIAENYIENSLLETPEKIKSNAVVIWLGSKPEVRFFKTKNKTIAEVSFFDKKKDWVLETNQSIAEWLEAILPQLIISEQKPIFNKDFVVSFEQKTKDSFESFTTTKTWWALKENGLLIL